MAWVLGIGYSVSEKELQNGDFFFFLLDSQEYHLCPMTFPKMVKCEFILRHVAFRVSCHSLSLWNGKQWRELDQMTWWDPFQLWAWCSHKLRAGSFGRELSPDSREPSPYCTEPRGEGTCLGLHREGLTLTSRWVSCSQIQSLSPDSDRERQPSKTA